MIGTKGSAADEIRNMEVVLSYIEDLIKSDQSQWSMFYPVWPELMKDLPV